MLGKKHFIQYPYQMFLDKIGIELDYEFQWKTAEILQKQILGG